MKISLNFLVRIAGMVVLAYLGTSIGLAMSSPRPTPTEQLATQLLTLAGAGLGLLTTHLWTVEPIKEGLRYLRSISITELTAVTFGVLVGLVFALLLAVPLGYLPSPFGQFLPLLGAIVLAYLGAIIFLSRRKELAEWLRSSRSTSLMAPQQLLGAINLQRRYLVDTSAIIDGRVANVVQTGFVDGTLLVPHFVLHELQQLADSADEIKRGKGRRGLELLNSMQKEAVIPVEILDVDVGGAAVDDKLIALARQYQCPVITNDFNLGRVAELQGVRILNLNQLADAVRPPVVPGQDLQIIIRDVGREREQGISFLDDGTMVVVEDARRLIGQVVVVRVTRVYQTQTGRIVFANLVEAHPQGGDAVQEQPAPLAAGRGSRAIE